MVHLDREGVPAGCTWITFRLAWRGSYSMVVPGAGLDRSSDAKDKQRAGKGASEGLGRLLERGFHFERNCGRKETVVFRRVMLRGA